MQQIDLEPTGYRKQDRETGRWVQNVNKPMCRKLGIAVLVFLGILAVYGYTMPDILLGQALFAGLGAVAGGLLVLSAKSIDW